MMLRLAELLAGLSRLADLGYGHAAGEALRSSALAAVLGRSLDLDDDDLRAGMYTALLHHVGCVGYAHETARVFGDEFLVQVVGERANQAVMSKAVVTMIRTLTQGRSPPERAKLTFTALTRGPRFGESFDTASCEVGRVAARRLGLQGEVERSVYHSWEWWNGKSVPDRLAGEDIPLGARLALVSHVAVLFDTSDGVDAAVQAVRERGGRILDPQLVDHFFGNAEKLLGEIDASDPRDLVLEAEPRPVATVLDSELVDVAEVFGDLADLKTPHTHGHSRGVARLARDAGEKLGLSDDDLIDLEVAGLLHDVGRVAVSNKVWEKPGVLTSDEWEQVRLHAYHSERILAGSERLEPLAPLVGMHHERGDGSGYHRGINSADLPMTAQLLAAADSYQAMTQRRPHRPALAPEQAKQELEEDARKGWLAEDAVRAVLAAAGHIDPVVRREYPAGLTDREVEVLGLIAEGHSNKQIANRLVISRRTAEHHVQQIYTKIGTSSRAAAAMFAMEHRLL